MVLNAGGMEFIASKRLGNYREPPLQINIPIIPSLNQMAKDPTSVITTTLEFRLDHHDPINNVFIYKGELNV